MNSAIATGLLIVFLVSGLYTCFYEYRDGGRDAAKSKAEKDNCAFSGQPRELA